MNFIKQIEVSLKNINQARFQDLINHLLHIEGNKFMGAPGSVVGKEKTSKGAPDSFFMNGDKYVFIECTTQERLGKSKTFFEKLQSDLEHCFDESKTKIKKEDIEKVVLACTEKVSAEEIELLHNTLHKHNRHATLEVLNIQNLPLRIYGYPGLSEQYVGVTIVKGEIYNLPDFLTKTTKGLQPSLINEFVGREDEIKDAVASLEGLDILLLSGGAGVGKSKLAVALLEGMSVKKYIPIVIQSSVVPLWDDFVHLFQNGRDYIILFDDANKSVQNLTYLLDFVQKPKSYNLKVIITSRDYVKDQVIQRLENLRYREFVVEKFKDEDIEKIILKALPNLNYYPEIKRKIVALSKGNARLALMATYSVTPESDTNYLDNPILLYEKYFEKIADEIEAFTKPIALQALAVVSFFGILDRYDVNLQEILEKEFDIDWNELWEMILHLHTYEILDVYSNDIVKVSDQVLSTYAFYKCFVDPDTAKINYAQWISIFISSKSHRIKLSLIDVNNSFDYRVIKGFVTPQLEKITSSIHDNELLYDFYSIFWFYQKYATLVYIKKWVNDLNEEVNKGELKFEYTHNNHTQASKYFDLLTNFWSHGDELLTTAIELAIELVAKQSHRLPEFLKFIDDFFSYRWDDIEEGYKRQNILLDTLSKENRSDFHKKIAIGTFLNIGEKLLGWHFTQYGGNGGRGITIYNFDLYNSPELLSLRKKILEELYLFFQFNLNQSYKILEKVIRPGAKFDKNIYLSEHTYYKKLINDKLSPDLYADCNFVERLAKKVESAGGEVPSNWQIFIQSEVMSLYKLFNSDFLSIKDMTWQEAAEDKNERIQSYVSSKKWPELKTLIYKIDKLYIEQSLGKQWTFQSALSVIFIAIANKNKNEIQKALNIYFRGELSSPMEPRVINFILNNNVLTGKELLSLIESNNCEEEEFWVYSLLAVLPEQQIDIQFVEILISIFENYNKVLPIHSMIDFVKYENAFELFKENHTEANLGQYNIVSYLTEILLKKSKTQKIGLGFQFCQDAGLYFHNHIHLLKQAYLYLKKHDSHFDYKGKDLAAVLLFDRDFLIECLENGTIGLDFYAEIRFEDLVLDPLWDQDDYEVIIEKLFFAIKKHSVFSYIAADNLQTMFVLHEVNDDRSTKIESFYSIFINKYFNDEDSIVQMLTVIYQVYQAKFIEYLKRFLLLNNNVDIIKDINFDRTESWSGSRVPLIQRKIDFANEILSMIKSLPNVLDYYHHIRYFEQRISWCKEEIKIELREDFMEN